MHLRSRPSFPGSVPFDSRIVCAAVFLVAILAFGCGMRQLPIDRLKSDLKDVPDATIILDDMEERGAFLTDYFHKYRVVTDQGGWTTDWLEVPEDYYRKEEPFLGMALYVKKGGEQSGTPQPAGYAYVGDPRYGQWQKDSSGNSFWEFYGKYALLSHLWGMGTGTIFRRDYDTYRQYETSNRPYYGPNNQYGTEGSLTKKQKPNFYARRMQRERARKASFKDRVENRIGRTKTDFRSRSSSWGK